MALLDCLSPMWSDVAWNKTRHGRGHFPKTGIPKPLALQDIPRQYSRYGLPLDAVKQSLIRMYPVPDLVLLTCTMTYWYPGALSMASLVKKIWPGMQVVLGGIYATLCFEHARQQGVFDLVVQGPLEDPHNWERLWGLLGTSAPRIPDGMQEDFEQKEFFPAEFSVVLGSRGCPFSCDYCASKCLYPGFRQRGLERVWQEVASQLDNNICDFVFYDDALLLNPENWLVPLLERLSRLRGPIRLHTPNALHVRYLTPDMCKLLYDAGLRTVRLGLESADFGDRPDSKLTREEWDYGLKNLFRAGFKSEQLGAYILFGLPGQDTESIATAISFARECGVRPHLAYYSPIPGSKLFSKAVEESPYPIDREPLFQNRAVWPCYPGGFSWEEHAKWQALLKKA